MIEEYSNAKYKELFHSRDTLSGYITFFTPTFNRGNLLPRVYECLDCQTNKHFVWIIVNDGSRDNTDEVAKELLNKDRIPILYVSKDNGGKHSAFQQAFSRTKTEFFQCMDDDDLYDNNSVEILLQEWDKILKEGKYSEIGAIRTLVREDNGFASNIEISNKDIGSHIDISSLDYIYKMRVSQENWTCYRTEALKQVDLFPTGYWLHEYHKFFMEGIWQGRFARKFKSRYLKIALREYRHDTECSIIRSNKSRQHYMDMFINKKLLLEEQYDYISLNKLNLLKSVALLSILRHKLGIPFTDMLHNTQYPVVKILELVIYPFCWMSRKPQIKN